MLTAPQDHCRDQSDTEENSPPRMYSPAFTTAVARVVAGQYRRSDAANGAFDSGEAASFFPFLLLPVESMKAPEAHTNTPAGTGPLL